MKFLLEDGTLSVEESVRRRSWLRVADCDIRPLFCDKLQIVVRKYL